MAVVAIERSGYEIDGLIRIERRHSARAGGSRVLIEMSTGQVIQLAGAMDRLITRAAQATLTSSYGDDAPSISIAQRLIADGDIS